MKTQLLTMHIAYGGQSANNETNMNKLNDNEKMNRSAENPATSHMRSRYRYIY